MTLSTTLPIPAAFYRGYQLGNGINDWVANPEGSSQFIPRKTLYGSRANIQVVGQNSYTRISVNAFTFGQHSTPKQLHDWWAQLLENIWVTDPNPLSDQDRNLVFIADRNNDVYELTSGLTSGDQDLPFSDTTGLAVGDVILLVQNNVVTDVASDAMVITEIDGLNVTASNIRIGGGGVVYDYTLGTFDLYLAEAAWRDVALESAPNLGLADDASLGNFRKSIPFSFITNQDRFPTVS